MNKPIVAVELSHSAVKVTIGYTLDNQPLVLYAAYHPLRGAIENGHISNPSLLSGALKKALQEAEQKTNYKIFDIVLALPAVGMQVFQANRSSTVVATSGKIETIDVKNVVNIMRRDAQVENTTIVGIIPDLYSLDDGKKFVEPPLGYVSGTLSIHAKIHLLPTDLCNEYAHIVEAAGYKLAKGFVGQYAYAEFLNSYANLPDGYIAVDAGAKQTKLSLIAYKALYGTVTVDIGGDDLINEVKDAFNLDTKQAEALIIKYGYYPNQTGYEAKITDYVNEAGITVPLFIRNLATVIENWLEKYREIIDVGLQQLVTEQGDNTDLLKYPLVFSGGLAELNGMKDYMSTHITNKDVIFITPRTFGARHGRYNVTLGLIKAYSRYKVEIGDEINKVTYISRDKGNIN